MKVFSLDSIMRSLQGQKTHLFPTMKPILPRWNQVSPARICFWPNCCQWLSPIHLHRSPLKRDVDELNECANYTGSVWGACCNCIFVCGYERARVCACISDFMVVHACLFLYAQLCGYLQGTNNLTLSTERLNITAA